MQIIILAEPPPCQERPGERSTRARIGGRARRKNKLSEYVRLAQGGETILVTDRDRVVGELIPPREGWSPMASDAVMAKMIRKGWVTPVPRPLTAPPAAVPHHELRGVDAGAEPLTANRLLQYAVCNRLHARRLARSHGDQVRDLLDGVSLVERTPLVLARALEPFPTPVRTLDALHLATMDFLRDHGQRIELASYDTRLLAGARALAIPIRSL